MAIRASMNLGLSDQLKGYFSDIVSIPRPLVKNLQVPNPHWLAGFTSGEGCFLVNMIRSSLYRTGFQVRLVFSISQHNRDKELMTSLIEYLGCGNVYENREAVDFIISKLSDLQNKVIPFFEKYPIQGVKSSDYLDFVKVMDLMINKAHITKEGVDQICKIKAGMNKGRSIFNEKDEPYK